MDPPGGQDERVQQQERLQREEAYYHFINGLSEEEYRLMRDSNLLGTPGEVTAEELRLRLDGAKERLSSQPNTEPNPQSSETGEPEGGNGGVEAGREASNGDSLLEWLNTFRRTGNATRSGQSGNQTWRAVSRTNPNSGEFRFSLEININHEQPEPDLLSDPPSASHSRSARSRRPQARRARSGSAPAPNASLPVPEPDQLGARGAITRDQLAAAPEGGRSVETESPTRGDRDGQDCPPSMLAQPGHRRAASRRSRTQLRGHRTGGANHRFSRRSRSPLRRPPNPSAGHANVPEPQAEVAMETASEPAEDAAPSTEPTSEAETPATGVVGGGVRRHPTIMLDLQVRRIRPGENRDRDSIASRTRSRVRTAENTVTFESDSGGFRRTISRSERAGIRTYVSTIRIPLRRISETGLGEPSSTALRSILRQIMTGFGELSSLMETEADAEGAVPDPPPAYRVHSGEEARPQEQLERHGADGQGTAGGSGDEERTRVGGVTAEGRGTARDTNNLVENGTLPILRLAHFFLLNEDEDDEHPHGLTKEQIDNLSTRTYGQASTEGELGRTCSVCINEYAQGNKLRRLPCAHEFHIHCIDRWLSQNNTCPICRQPILATDSAPST